MNNYTDNIEGDYKVNKIKYYLIIIIRKIRPAIIQLFIINLIFGNSNKRRFHYHVKKLNLFFYIDPFTWIGKHLIEEGSFEPTIIEEVKKNININSVFFDIGANEGFFSIIASSQGENNRIYSFEPQSRLLPIIKENFKKNNLKNYEIVNSAVGKASYSTYINLFPEHISEASSKLKPYRFSKKKEKINIIDLDTFVLSKNIKTIDLMKIDVEGFEIDVVEGMKKILEKKIPKRILLDYHKNYNSTEKIEKTHNTILQFGYKSKASIEDKSFVLYQAIKIF